MARLFDDGSSEYLAANSAPATTAPFTMAAWFRSDDDAIRQVILSLGSSSVWDNALLDIRGDAAGDKVRAVSFDQGTGQTGVAVTSSGYSANTWHHGCAVFASSTDRRAFIDGGSKGTNATDVSLSSIDQCGIGASHRKTSPSLYFSSRIAEAAIWNVALIDAEVASLAAGFSPLFVRPQNLVAYWPLIRDEDQDRVGGYDMTAYNTPAIAVHPPMIYPAPSHIIAVPVSGSFEQAVAGALTSAGVLGRKTAVSHLGTLTSSGALMRQVSIGLTGILTSAGALACKVSIGLMGTLTSSGALATAKKAYLALAGTLTSAGALSRKIAVGLAGTLTSAGALSIAKKVYLALAGTLTSAGALKQKAAIGLSGTLASAGALGRKASLALTGTLTSSGILGRKIAMDLAGTLSSAGALGRKTSLALAGTLASAGELGRKVAIALAGMLTSSGTLGRHIAKTLAGTLTSSGILVTSLTAAAARLYATIVDALTSGAAISTASVGGMIIADTRVDAATVDDA